MHTTAESATSSRLLTQQEVCQMFSRGPVTLWRWQKAGKLHPIYIAGKPRYRPDEVERLASEGDGTAPRPPVRPTAGAAA